MSKYILFGLITLQRFYLNLLANVWAVIIFPVQLQQSVDKLIFIYETKSGFHRAKIRTCDGLV